MNAEVQIECIETLAETINALLDVDPDPLKPTDVALEGNTCITRISSIDGPYPETWKKINAITHERLDENLIRTKYIDPEDDHERAIIFARHPELMSLVKLKLQYHTSGRISIYSFVDLYIDAQNPYPDETRDFICVRDHQSLETDEISDRRNQLVERINQPERDN